MGSGGISPDGGVNGGDTDDELLAAVPVVQPMVAVLAVQLMAVLAEVLTAMKNLKKAVLTVVRRMVAQPMAELRMAVQVVRQTVVQAVRMVLTVVPQMWFSSRSCPRLSRILRSLTAIKSMSKKPWRRCPMNSKTSSWIWPKRTGGDGAPDDAKGAATHYIGNERGSKRHR